MKKRMLSLLLVLVMLLGLLPTAALAAPASGGSGTEADPYLIATAQDLADFRDAVNGSAKKSTSKLCAKLTANIDLSTLGDRDWTPIGYYTGYSDCVYYGGTFDGGGFTISGLIDQQHRAVSGAVRLCQGRHDQGSDRRGQRHDLDDLFGLRGRYRRLRLSCHD